MEKEKSCGTMCFNGNKVLMVKHNAGHWAFPKGHVEENETEVETAIRETKEETGIESEIISDQQFIITYSPKENVIKDVIYFIAKPKNSELNRQESEIADLDWVNIEEAEDRITFDDEKELYQKVKEVYINKFLNK